jgi:hypothetical protein
MRLERDPLGNPLPNLFDKTAPDLTGQTILTQRNPDLAALCKQIAESPWKAWADWQDQCAAVLKKRAFKYDANTHLANPWAGGANETEKARFVKEHPDLVEQNKNKSLPVHFPVGKEFNLIAQGRIARISKAGSVV